MLRQVNIGQHVCMRPGGTQQTRLKITRRKHNPVARRTSLARSIHLISHEYIAYYLPYDEAKSALADNREDVCGITSSLFGVTEASEGLQSPRFEDGYITVHFPDAFEHLVYILIQ